MNGKKRMKEGARTTLIIIKFSLALQPDFLTSIPACSENTNTLCGSIDGIVRSGSDEGRIRY